MAKSVEDTAFYRYHRLLALNEVGGEARRAGLQPEAFHRLAAWRLEHWPDTLLATATHDTKRGEDARARLAVLSELPVEWAAAVGAWRDLNAAIAADPSGGRVCSLSVAGRGVAAGAGPRRRDRRLRTLGRPAGRLADQVAAGGEGALRLERSRPRLRRPGAVVPAGSSTASFPVRRRPERFRRAGSSPPLRPTAWPSLLVKLTAPGVPDIYQGTENSRFQPGRSRQPAAGGFPGSGTRPDGRTAGEDAGPAMRTLIASATSGSVRAGALLSARGRRRTCPPRARLRARAGKSVLDHGDRAPPQPTPYLSRECGAAVRILGQNGNRPATLLASPAASRSAVRCRGIGQRRATVARPLPQPLAGGIAVDSLTVLHQVGICSTFHLRWLWSGRWREVEAGPFEETTEPASVGTLLIALAGVGSRSERR